MDTNFEVKQTQSNTSTEKQQSENSTHLMRVKKRDGRLEAVDVTKIVNVVLACASGLENIDPMRVATKTISGLYDGATTEDLDNLCIQTAALLISQEPQYSQLASRLLSRFIREEVEMQGVRNFYESIKMGYEQGLINETTFKFVKKHKEALNILCEHNRDKNFEYLGLKTVYDRYLLKHPIHRKVIERPQDFLLRMTCGLCQNFSQVKEFYDLTSNFNYLPSSPTLFNSGTLRPQLSSCYLLDSPKDDLKEIFKKYSDIALLSKYAGGIGVSFSKIRSRGSLIKGTNGFSNGLVPWLKVLDSSVSAVNQGGRRKGAACVYLETWHADIEEFLELRDNTGNEACRTHNLNLANWIPDLFMKRVEANAQWSLFDPSKAPELTDLFGEEFEKRYEELEAKKVYVRQISAQEL